MNELWGKEATPLVVGAGEMELKLTRSLMLAPWKPETGFGAANWVFEVAESGRGKFGIDGFDD